MFARNRQSKSCPNNSFLEFYFLVLAPGILDKEKRYRWDKRCGSRNLSYRFHRNPISDIQK